MCTSVKTTSGWNCAAFSMASMAPVACVHRVKPHAAKSTVAVMPSRTSSSSSTSMILYIARLLLFCKKDGYPR